MVSSLPEQDMEKPFPPRISRTFCLSDPLPLSRLIETAHIDKYEELKSLMSWKFQSFKKVKFLGV